MLPGKKYTAEDVMAIMRRRVWWLLVPLAVGSAATGAFVRTLPDLYHSETLILIVPQRVPESYVRSTVTTRIEDRLLAISQEILSRTRLEQLIREFDLYADERRVEIMEDIVQRMRTQHIDIQVQKGDAFRLSYVGQEPRTVMRVTERLASFFIEESLRHRQVLAEGTNQFLETELKEAHERLLAQEKKLEEFRQRYAGELPSQVDANLQAMGSIQVQMQSILQQVDRDQERRIALERQLGELEAQAEALAPALVVPPVPAAAAAGEVPPTGRAADQLAAAKAALAAARVRLTPEHPDVRALERRIRELEVKAEAEALQVPVSTAAPRSPAEAARQRRITEVRDELDRIDSNIAQMRKEEERLRAAAGQYQARAQAAPTRESELTELMRDYGPLQSLYFSLLAKKEDARIAANLEQRQIGEQFRVLDQARLPERPFSPNRRLFISYGLGAGLAVGVGLVGLLEYRDRTFKTDDEASLVLSLPVLAVVPLMTSDRERRRNRRRRWLANLGLGAGVAGCFAVLVYTLIA